MPQGRTPGPSVKYPDQYEALRARGISKSEAAAIANARWNKNHGKVKNRQAYTNVRTNHVSVSRQMAAAIVNARHNKKRLPRPLLPKAKR